MESTFFSIQSSSIHFVEEHKSALQWAGLTAKYQQIFSHHPAKTWLLYEPDSFIFSAIFMALLSAEKSVVLPQNGQPEHIKHVKESVEASVGDVSLQPTVPSTVDYQAGPHIELRIPLSSNIAFYTSGSTGVPKVINKQYKLLQREVDVLETEFASKVSGSTFLSTVPHQHIYGLLFKMLWPMTKGHRLVSQAFEYPEQLATKIKLAKLEKVTIVSSPAQLHRMALDNPLLPVKEQVETIFSSGGPLDANKNVSLQKSLTCEIVEVFGSTETGGIGWRHKHHPNDNDWQAFNNIKLGYQPNCDLLAISSPYIEQDVYYADDRVEIVADDRFRVLGRADSVVKIEEKRISLDEVQDRLKQHELVDDAFVVVIGTTRRKLAALIVLNGAGQQASQKLKKIELNHLFRDFLSNWYEALLLPKNIDIQSNYPIMPEEN
ncbi:AMP-binding protein [Paraglaciecola aquimarina]|uniref:AMP-binding protein n=1 Tax=Paraglaciecola aquimarina TaxID=1235557 RepID=A0ABU3SSU4_9ALTE|nr:AMP-binding protein [Paraglaciecola aquimarina]MDU0353055.1 AMP-binding protein [Paraglaciecola aquimarina]